MVYGLVLHLPGGAQGRCGGRIGYLWLLWLFIAVMAMIGGVVSGYSGLFGLFGLCRPRHKKMKKRQAVWPRCPANRRGALCVVIDTALPCGLPCFPPRYGLSFCDYSAAHAPPTVSSPAYYAAGAVLFLLMTVFAQTFLAFVRGHLVAFSLFSAGHCVCFWILVSVYVLAC